MIKGLISVLLILGGCGGPSPPQGATGCPHPVELRGQFADYKHMIVTLRDSRDLEAATDRLTAKYHVDADSDAYIRGFRIYMHAMTEQAARALAEQLRCEPDVEL